MIKTSSAQTTSSTISKEILNELIIKSVETAEIITKETSEITKETTTETTTHETIDDDNSAQYLNIISADEELLNKHALNLSDLSPSSSLDECYICNNIIDPKTEDFKLKPFKLPCNCKQYTHAKCMLKWLRMKSKCPTCKYNFSDSENVTESTRLHRGHSQAPQVQSHVRLFRKILQWIMLVIITILRLYVVYIVLGKVGLSLIAVVFLSYYAKKCYDSRTILPINVVFRLPI